MKPAANQLSGESNRISFYNDNIQNLWINKVFNKLPKYFEATILSGMPEQTNAQNIGTVTEKDIQEVNDNRYYFVRIRPLISSELVLPNPFYAPNLPDAKRLINMHPIAYIEVNKTVHPPTHGDVFECVFTNKKKLSITLLKRVRSSGLKIGMVSNRNLHKAYLNSPATLTPSPNDSSDYSGGLDNPWKLKPKKGIYRGSYLPNGTEVLNGYPVYGSVLLQVPDTRFWELKGSGTGALLKDYIGDFNRMVEHFFNDFGRKFRSNGMRSFKTQMRLRRSSVKKGKCPGMKSSGCSTARPGTSNHGWGQAVDIKSTSGGFIGWKSKEYLWMVENAATYNWRHPSWAQKDGSMPEQWHWEPMNKVIEIL